MHVTFPVPMPTAEDLRNRYANKGGFGAVGIKLRFADGRFYEHDGQLEFVDITVAQDTDTITLRGVVPNPNLAGSKERASHQRELTDGQFIMILEAAKPVDQLAIPRKSVMSDQRGDFVYVIGAEDKVERRAIKFGQSTPGMAVITEQRVQPGMPVDPAPAETSQLTPNVSSAERGSDVFLHIRCPVSWRTFGGRRRSGRGHTGRQRQCLQART
jgi:membrane fusion protein (multidrug efflux system)